MFCDYCGNKIPDGSSVCPICGHPVTDYEYESLDQWRDIKMPGDSEKKDKYSTQTNRSKSWRNRPAAVLITAAALSVTAIVLIYYFHQSTGNQTNNFNGEEPAAHNSVTVSSQSEQEPASTAGPAAGDSKTDDSAADDSAAYDTAADNSAADKSTVKNPITKGSGQKESETWDSSTVWNMQEDNGNTSTSPFYGVWVIGSKDLSECETAAADLTEKGFAGKVYITTDWENLNQERWYVVSAGECTTEEEAEQILAQVKANGYADAYVKYTGEHR